MSHRSRLFALAIFAAVVSAPCVLGGCVAEMDQRTCCRGILCGYPPDKDGNCAGPNGESAESLDEPEAHTGTAESADAPPVTATTPLHRIDVDARRARANAQPIRHRSTGAVPR